MNTLPYVRYREFFVAAAALWLVVACDVRAETVRAGGTGAATELLKRLGAAFSAREPGTTLEVIPSLGSTGAIAAVADGEIDVAVSGRLLRVEEIGKGLTGEILARSPFGLASSERDPGGLASRDVAAFFSSTTAIWPSGAPVRVVLRPKSESDTARLAGLFPGMAEAIDRVRVRPEVVVAATDQDNAAAAETIPGSLAAISLAQIRTENRALRFLSIDGVMPTLEAFESGRYPYGKDFQFIVAATASPTTRRFVEFAGSAAAAEVLRAAGCLPSTVRIDPVR